jgi:hypothetical protein
MAKYKARHKCRKHVWVEISSGYNMREGFWYHYACLNCDNIKSVYNPILND